MISDLLGRSPDLLVDLQRNYANRIWEGGLGANFDSVKPEDSIPLPHPYTLQLLSPAHSPKMVVYYQIAGKKVGSHVLAMATLGAIFTGTWAATGSSSKPKTAAGPPINASSKDEGDFIQQFLAEADSGDKKAGH
ncbi:hypothetical protein N7468_006679 [Penicillium chermesinum]|uniref:Uncharacterized protein n=1 Tax=Penicillium chermesinum TaxID=63820 RepID=A0A9W9TK23_9EURO|nr:uncharacterized protein N7468_006679 [Penicillium chermesinum]KAJ5225454.1 hypothetical protein N7468_006679 [Penicillium chermesinum]KAJ6161318.1 hypothetical protein N7470_004714 [Penicillium chermesinum]